MYEHCVYEKQRGGRTGRLIEIWYDWPTVIMRPAPPWTQTVVWVYSLFLFIINIYCSAAEKWLFFFNGKAVYFRWINRRCCCPQRTLNPTDRSEQNTGHDLRRLPTTEQNIAHAHYSLVRSRHPGKRSIQQNILGHFRNNTGNNTQHVTILYSYIYCLSFLSL